MCPPHLYIIAVSASFATAAAFAIPNKTISNIVTRDEGSSQVSPGAIAGIIIGCLALTAMFSFCMWRRNRWQPSSISSRKSYKYPASPPSPYLPRYRESQYSYDYPQSHYHPSAPPQYYYSAPPRTVALPPAVYLPPAAGAGSGHHYVPRSTGRHSSPPLGHGNGRKTVRFGEVGVRRY